MRSSIFLALNLAVLGEAVPRVAQRDLGDLLGGLEGGLSQIEKVLGGLALEAVKALGESHNVDSTFDAAAQLVDVEGKHEWKAPGANDERGPCPGLNALANHGYLPRNGKASILDLIGATHSVYGMGLDLSTILTVYGAVLDGPVLGWSIGGKQHTGISGSHNNYETDSSPMRGDLDQYGNNEDLVIAYFKKLYDMQPNASTANYNLDVLGEFRAERYKDSVSKNPNFFYGPFTGVAVSQAAFTFIYRFMANHTEESPEGVLDQDILKSFFSVAGDSDSLSWARGQERIPKNWYRRPVNDTYGLNQLAGDIGTFSKAHPFIGQPGCNMGKVNSFVAIDPSNTDAAGYDFANPLHAVCYGIASATKAVNIPVVGAVVQELLFPIQDAINCPTVPSTGESLGKDCPGYSLFGGPTAPKAAGAIED